MLVEEEFPSLPETPCLEPSSRQTHNGHPRTDLRTFSAGAEQIRCEKLVERNSSIFNEMKVMKQIPKLKETIEFICTDISALKDWVTHAEYQLKQAVQCAKEQERWLTLLVGYSHRNLRIHELQERGGVFSWCM